MQLPEWIGPPENMLGGVVALGLVAARSKEAAVRLESATAYPNGVQFRLDVRWRDHERSVGMSGARYYARRNWRV